MYSVVSLFCGCGGVDLGTVGGFTFNRTEYAKHPCKLVYACDIDQKAIVGTPAGGFYFPPRKPVEGNWIPLSVAVPELAIEDKKYYFSERAVQGMKTQRIT